MKTAPNVWAIAAPMLEKALAYQKEHSIEDVADAIDRGDAQLWCGDKSVLVTEMLKYPRRKVCRIWLASGEKDELVYRMLPDVETWAASRGCAAVEVVGRKGWLRLLDGYTQPATVLSKEIG